LGYARAVIRVVAETVYFIDWRAVAGGVGGIVAGLLMVSFIDRKWD